MPKQLPTIITFTGAGATGKTSLVEALAKMMPEKAVIHRSIVREFYASRGVENEGAFLKMEAADRRDFQIALYTYYLDAIEKFVSEGTHEVVLCERSVFDHFAYTLYGTREMFRDEDMKLLQHGIRRFLGLKPNVFYLAYPTPWDAQGADGFRAREVAKDTLVDAMICKLLSQSRAVWTGTVPFLTVQDRAMFVIRAMWGK